MGSGQEFKSSLKWVDTPTGGRYALNQFAVPAAAKLGVYEISMSGLDTTGQFRVEEFRLPVLQGQMGVPDKNALINASSLPVQVQMSYVAGGAASGLPMQVSALLRERDLQFSDYEEFSFQDCCSPRPNRRPRHSDNTTACRSRGGDHPSAAKEFGEKSGHTHLSGSTDSHQIGRAHV